MSGTSTIQPEKFHFEASTEWLMNEMLIIWKPFLTGCFTLAVVSAALGFFTMRLLWRLHIIRYINQKRLNRKLKK